MRAYHCWAYPFAGLGYGLVFPDQAYYWYPRAGVSVYLEVPEKEDAPSTYAFIENEKDEDLYYALYRKVDSDKISYLVKVSDAQKIDTAKTVKVYLPKDASKEKEYVVIARRNEGDLKDSMDEKGNDVDANIIDQIKQENKDIVKAQDVAVEEPSKKEAGELKETRQKALAHQKELMQAVDNIDKQDKSKLPTKEQLEKEKSAE
jgi:hypothetical protein